MILIRYQKNLFCPFRLIFSDIVLPFTLQWLPEILIRYQKNLYCPFRLIFFDIVVQGLNLSREESCFAFAKKFKVLSHFTRRYSISLHSSKECFPDLNLAVNECCETLLELIKSFHFGTGLICLLLRSAFCSQLLNFGYHSIVHPLTWSLQWL